MTMDSTNYCLRALMAKGLVELQNFARSNSKLGDAYVLTLNGFVEKADMTRRFLKRKQQEYALLQEEIQALSDEVKRHEGAEIQKT